MKYMMGNGRMVWKMEIEHNNNKILICEFKNYKREEEVIVEFKKNEDYLKIKFKIYLKFIISK